MPTNQKSTTPNFFGLPPLLEGEDAKAYDELLARVTAEVNPSDVLEEIWTRDVVHHTWDILRWRRWKANVLKDKMTDALERLLVRPLHMPLECEFLVGFQPTPAKELAHKWAAGDPSAIKQVEELLFSVGRSMESVQSKALEMAIAEIARIERMAMSAEARRNATLREIDRHRDRKPFGRALRDQVRNIEDAELNRVGIKTIAPVDATKMDAA